MPAHDSLADSADVAQHIAAQSLVGAVNGNAVDMQGWDGCMFILNVGAITATGTLNALIQRDVTSAFATASTVTGVGGAASITQLVSANSNVIVVIDVLQPIQRFLRMVATQATAAVLASATAIRYRRNGILPPPVPSPLQIVRVVNG